MENYFIGRSWLQGNNQNSSYLFW